MLTFTKAILGCYADGSFGHRHVRDVLADMVERFDAAELAEELRGEMSDDASEEYDALELLNEHTDGEVFFEFVDGDLCLMESEEI